VVPVSANGLGISHSSTLKPALCFVQVINDEDVNWIKADYSGQIGYVPATYVNYIKPP